MLKFKFLTSFPITSSLIHSTYSKSYTIIYDQFNEAIKIPQKWVEDIKHVEFSELLASSIGPLALFFSWKKRHKEEFSKHLKGHKVIKDNYLMVVKEIKKAASK